MVGAMWSGVRAPSRVKLSVLMIVAAIVVGVSVPASAGASQPTTAGLSVEQGGAAAAVQTAADLSGFAAGSIIEDDVFFNRGTMTEAQIQSFLQAKVTSCRAGYTCLKDYYDTTRSIAGDAMCGAYAGGTRERASRIIYKVAQACGINPQVLVVMLQKEQGLVTSTAPSSYAYRAAMGQGCPDTAACDTRYYGFFNQVFGGAWQLKRYANPPGTSQFFTWYAPGKTWNVLYHPNSGCGTSKVTIQNQATANLYYYTPYQPNAAALRAGYGTGDSCSSYGNRNFYNYFTDWFGSTRYNLRPAVDAEWERLGGSDGVLGSPSAREVRIAANGGGYLQAFQKGTIWWKDGAARAVGIATSALRVDYFNSGGPAGPWGWLTSEPRCGLIDDGCLLIAQHGTVGHSTATGSVLIPPALAVEWNRVGAAAVGYPTQAARCGMVDGGCLMPFQRGTVGYSPASGAMTITPDLAQAWNRLGATIVGYPVAPATFVDANGGGSMQEFTRGTLWASPVGAVHMAPGVMASQYATAGGPAGAWGWPAGSPRCGMVGDGCLMVFQHGTVGYSPASGAVLVPAAGAAVWNRVGAQALGYPKSAATASAGNGGGVTQDFTAGAVVTSPSGAVALRSGAFLEAYRAAGGGGGALGWPASDPRCGMVRDGCLMVSQLGTIGYSPATGARLIPAPIAKEWNRLGAVRLGYPTAAATTTGTLISQVFQSGTVTYDSATGRTTVR
nr:hypothetical protein [Microbacterium sp. MF43]